MRVEDGVRYYEDGERVLTGFQWNSESEQPGAAIGYYVDGEDTDMMCILAEVTSQEDIKKIWELAPKYREKNCEILRRTNTGGMLL